MLHYEAEHHQHITPTKNYFLIWLMLVFLTVVTVGISYVDMHKFTVFAAMLVATVKVMLVVLFFMHLIHEKKVYWLMILAALSTYGIFVILTFADYYYRF